MPLVAWTLIAGNARANPTPSSKAVGRIASTYTGLVSTRGNSTYPKVIAARPPTISLGVPIRSITVPAHGALNATRRPVGSNASAMCNGDQPSVSWQ